MRGVDKMPVGVVAGEVWGLGYAGAWPCLGLMDVFVLFHLRLGVCDLVLHRLISVVWCRVGSVFVCLQIF